MRAALERFRDDIRDLARIYDFHQRSRITEDRALYRDPMHCRDDVVEEVGRILFTGDEQNDIYTLRTATSAN